MCVSAFNLRSRPRTRNLDPDNPPPPLTLPTRNQLYMLALTTLYLYDYLLTFADEVPFASDNQAGAHLNLTPLLVGQVCVGRKENLG